MYVVPLLIFVILALLSPWLDWQISNFIYTSHGGAFYKNSFLLFLYDYGIWPAWIVALLCLIPFLFPRWQRYRRPALLYLITFGLGTGLIISLLKDFWPRPRPVQVIDWGGKSPFKPFFEPLFDGTPHKSFPSGHAASGFVFFALFWGGILIRDKSLKILGLTLGITFGLLLSSMRILMGAHFFFDTIASAALMWFLPAGIMRVLKWKN